MNDHRNVAVQTSLLILPDEGDTEPARLERMDEIRVGCANGCDSTAKSV